MNHPSDAPPCCPAAVDSGAPADALRAALAERDETIEQLRTGLEQARLTLLWYRAEVAARDQRIADLWEQADGLSRTLAEVSAERDLLRASASEGGPAPTPRPRSLLALAGFRRRTA